MHLWPQHSEWVCVCGWVCGAKGEGSNVLYGQDPVFQHLQTSPPVGRLRKRTDWPKRVFVWISVALCVWGCVCKREITWESLCVTFARKVMEFKIRAICIHEWKFMMENQQHASDRWCFFNVLFFVCNLFTLNNLLNEHKCVFLNSSNLNNYVKSLHNDLSRMSIKIWQLYKF